MTMRYAIVDAAARPDTPQALRYFIEGHPARSLFENQPEHALGDAAPWLVQVDGNPGMAGWLPALDLEAGAVTWLESPADFGRLYQHLQRQLDLRMPDGSLALLRYWDGRVFRRLLRVLDAEQKRELLGPIEQWQVTVDDRLYALRKDSLA